MGVRSSPEDGGRQGLEGKEPPRQGVRGGILPALLAGALVSVGTGTALLPTATGAIAAEGMRTVALNHDRVSLREEGDAARAEAQAMDAELAARDAVVTTDGGAPAGYWEWSGIGEDGIMATLRVPRLGLVLPVRAGTSDEVLAHGLGHMPGTSMPVGGAGTKCVVAGHTDYRDLELFSRIGELDQGDEVTLTSAAGRLAYQVAQVRVASPTDTTSLRREEGRDLLTLLTCYPPGVNTHRLLVTCERAAESTDPAAPDGDAKALATSPAPEDDCRRMPGWVTAALCALVSLASGAVVALASAYPAICRLSRKRAEASQGRAGQLVPCLGTRDERRGRAGRR